MNFRYLKQHNFKNKNKKLKYNVSRIGNNESVYLFILYYLQLISFSKKNIMTIFLRIVTIYIIFQRKQSFISFSIQDFKS